MDELTALPGIGKKSASVIMKEWGREAEGVIVDLHVVRVARRIGIAAGEQPEKTGEKQEWQSLFSAETSAVRRIRSAPNVP